VPLQPPLAVQDVALVELQVSVEDPPPAIVVGYAVSAAVATGLGGVTVTVAVAGGLVPPAPVHVNEYAMVAVRAAVVWVPLAAIVPLQPPEAVHDVALVELQVSVEVAPLAIGLGLAVSAAVGMGLAAVTATVAAAAVLVPPEPVQISEYVVSAVKAPVLWLPLLANAPVQPPEALHAVALVELQVNVAAAPLLTAVGTALIDAVGGGGAAVSGTDPDPPQAAKSSTAPIVMTGARQRIGVLSASRIMAAAGLCWIPFVPENDQTCRRIHAPHQSSSRSRVYYIILWKIQVEQHGS
jgi:hypothetical protein